MFIELPSGITVKDMGESVRITCYGEIGEWAPIDETSFASALEEAGDKPVEVCINSGGGCVSSALAIRSQLARHESKVTIRIDGMAASAATIIVCTPGAHVVASPSAMLMIHAPLFDAGLANAEELKKVIKSLEVCGQSLIAVYQEKTGLPEEQLQDLMEAETYLTARQALEYGFVDEIDTSVDALAVLSTQTDRVLGYSRKLFNTRRLKNLPMAKNSEEIRQEIRNLQEKLDNLIKMLGEDNVDAEDNPQEEEVPEGESGENQEEARKEDESRCEAEESPEEESAESQSNGEQQGLSARAAQEERDRIAALQALAPLGHSKELFRAMFEKPMSVTDYLKSIGVNDNARKEHYLEARDDDAKILDDLGTSGISFGKNKSRPEEEAFIAAARKSFGYVKIKK